MKKSILRNLVWITIIVLIIASILPNIYTKYWLIDLFAHFKLQYLIISILLIPIPLWLFKKKVLATLLLLVPMVWNSSYILPYYIDSPKSQESGDRRLRITSINLLSSNSHSEKVMNYVNSYDPDILVLMEFTPKWQNDLQVLSKKYSYKRLETREDNFGIAVLSKYPMNSSVEYFAKSDKPTIVSDITIDKDYLTVVATHPIPPINQKTFHSRNEQLIDIIENRESFFENLIIIGDFNTSSFSSVFDDLLVKDLRDSRIGFGLLPTWPSNIGILKTTLDHCLVSSRVKVESRSIGENIGSDHLPINIDVEF